MGVLTLPDAAVSFERVGFLVIDILQYCSLGRHHCGEPIVHLRQMSLKPHIDCLRLERTPPAARAPDAAPTRKDMLSRGEKGFA